MKKNTTSYFIKRAKEKQGEFYDYSLVDYKKSSEKVKIICPAHGPFMQTPNNHLFGFGCMLCGIDKRAKKKTLTTEEFIKRSFTIHKGKYNYNLSIYSGWESKLQIICKKHGIFSQTACNHLQGKGCVECGKEFTSNKFSLGLDVFLKRARENHDNEYSYDIVKYKNNNDMVKIICKEHGVFHKRAHKHLYRRDGCPKCKTSIGEKIIINYLKDNNIQFEFQKSFPFLKNPETKGLLKFDFYIKDYNMCIEFNGKQHEDWIHIKWIKDDEEKKIKFARSKQNDELKKTFCYDNKIEFLSINYDNRINIIEILNCVFNK